jgi:phosphate-selective porin OprO/OprP
MWAQPADPAAAGAAQSATTPAAQVQSSSASAKADLEARVEALERKLEQLEKRVDAALPPEAAAGLTATTSGRLDQLDQKVQFLEQGRQGKEAPVLTAGRDTFSISSPDKAFRLRIGGHLQADGKSFFDNQSHLLTSSFNLRRARPILEGSVGKYVDFRFVPDFGNGQTVLYDAYADIKMHLLAVLRAGKFKTPLGLEVLQNDAEVTFIERALPSDLLPNRDEGFQVYGNLLDRVSYAVAVVNGAPGGASIDGDTNAGKDVVGRIFATPFATGGPKALRGLGFGIGVSSGRYNGPTLPVFKTTGGQAIFFSYLPNTIAAGRRLTYSPQLYYYYGPFGLLAEYVESSQPLSLNSVTRDISNHAWQVAGSWVLTGEKKSYRSVVPRKGLEGGKSGNGLGAWELAARYTALNVDPSAFAVNFADPTKSAGAARTWTVGLNWYLNYFVRISTNYEQTHFQGGAVGGNRVTEKALEERVQVVF